MKKFLSVILTVAMIVGSMSCVTAFATDNGDVRQELNTLYLQQYSRFFEAGTFNPYTDSSISNVVKACDDVEPLLYDDSATPQQLQTAYDSLKNAVDNLCITDVYAQETYNLAMNEENINNWYTSKDWSAFVEARNDLKSALNTNDDSLVTVQFHSLLKAYNEMTCSYGVVGDIDKNGSVNINDVTLLQKYLAGQVKLCGAQKLLASVNDYNYENVSINSVTAMQKYILEKVTIDNGFYSHLISADFYTDNLNYLINPRSFGMENDLRV